MSNTSRLPVMLEMQRITARRRAPSGANDVLLEQIVDRDRALVLDVGTGAADRFLVERHRDEALLGGSPGVAPSLITD